MQQIIARHKYRAHKNYSAPRDVKLFREELREDSPQLQELVKKLDSKIPREEAFPLLRELAGEDKYARDVISDLEELLDHDVLEWD